MNKWKDLCDSAPRAGVNVAQELLITNVGSVRMIGENEVIIVAGTTADGVKHKKLTIPTESADLVFDPKKWTLNGGRISTSKKSYSPQSYEWGIESLDDTMQPVADISLVNP